MSGSDVTHPVLLRYPSAEGIPAEQVMPLPEWQYVVWQIGPIWHVTVRTTGELVYCGPGPVEVVGSPAPF